MIKLMILMMNRFWETSNRRRCVKDYCQTRLKYCNWEKKEKTWRSLLKDVTTANLQHAATIIDDDDDDDDDDDE